MEYKLFVDAVSQGSRRKTYKELSLATTLDPYRVDLGAEWWGVHVETLDNYKIGNPYWNFDKLFSRKAINGFMTIACKYRGD